MMFNKYYVLLAIIAQNAHCATENSTTGNQYCSKEDMACCGEKEVETEATPSIGNACKKYEEYPVRVVSKECYSNLNVLQQIRNLLKSARLRVQVYGVTTVDDGFVNMLYVANSSEKRLEQSVLLEAGFLIRGEAFGDKYGRSLAIYLANKGYEVWIGFLRGATVGFDRRGSIVKNEFGYDLDLVAGDDFNHKLYNIKNSRGNKPKLGKVVYIGHSFAATYGLMYASQKPDDAKKLIKAIISLAPVTTMANSKLKDFVVNKFPILADIYKTINISDSKTAPLRLLFVNYCMEKPIFCKDLIERVFGKSDQMLPEEMTLFLGNFPGKFTYKMLEQIAQIVKAGEVQKYKSTDKYDFSSVTLPVYTFYGETDAISTKEDVEALVKSLGSKKKPIQVVNKGNSFNHLDFLYAKDIEELLYKPILKILEEVKDL